MVVLSKDILTMPEDEIPTAEVRYTIVGGKVGSRSDKVKVQRVKLEGTRSSPLRLESF